MHVHILGICGTFMAGIAALAREAGHRVTGSDAAAWPPMSTQLAALGIEVMSGYDPRHLSPAPDVVIVGNVVSRGNPAIEHVLDAGLPYVSGPQWLAEHVLRGRHVLAVAGTHGKTTTASLLAWLLEHAGLDPGFLIGGVPQNFGSSARLGGGKHFIVEADEYDTAFFDKRSKFVHYGPRTLILNNLEFDHADIFPDLAAIERQFHHLVRTVPRSGHIVANGRDEAIARVLAQGCWSEVERFDESSLGEFASPLQGRHNKLNAIAAIAAARHAGVERATALAGLARFVSVKRRLELVGEARGVKVYDDFAHHPTAIEVTIDALRAQGGGPRLGRVLAVLEPRSNTMRMGSIAQALAGSLSGADHTFVYARPDLKWDAQAVLGSLGNRLTVRDTIDTLVDDIASAARAGDRVLVMSNGDFGGIHAKLVTALGKAPFDKPATRATQDRHD
ncbi:MAG TPA: UDP-N-acetylmuramate:L-alanyl-gamma-D-glutamyl-meso-diaminopimelate ligase [Verrucomicrobiae bacterium]|nr:UDP-N-acetylmuramate:L-alanyl-gamma-D-glutamyl-meso-diaminopimelate ligase [Verrucomicrobiae bacterium]